MKQQVEDSNVLRCYVVYIGTQPNIPWDLDLEENPRENLASRKLYVIHNSKSRIVVEIMDLWDLEFLQQGSAPSNFCWEFIAGL